MVYYVLYRQRQALRCDIPFHLSNVMDIQLYQPNHISHSSRLVCDAIYSDVTSESFFDAHRVLRQKEFELHNHHRC